MSTSFYKTRFEGLQVLRGLTALIILTEHVRFLGHGLFGVDIFFCLSGFMMMLSTKESGQYFFRRRLARLLPLYHLITVFSFACAFFLPHLFEQTKATLPNLIKSLLFIPFDIGNGAIQPLVRVGWTLNCEIFFAVLFAAGILICRALKLPHTWRFVLPATVQILLCVLAQCQSEPPLALRFYGNPVMLNFLFGMLAYPIARKIFERNEAKAFSARANAALILAAAPLAVWLFASRNIVAHDTFARVLCWEAPAFLLVLCFFTLGLSCSMPKALVRLGNISFSFYLLHYYPTMICDRYLFAFSAPRPAAFLGVAVAVASSTILAVLSYESIEKKLTPKLCHIFKIEKKAGTGADSKSQKTS